MCGNNRGRSGLSLDDADLHHRFHIPIREVRAGMLPECLQILRTGCDLRCGLRAIAASPARISTQLPVVESQNRATKP